MYDLNILLIQKTNDCTNMKYFGLNSNTHTHTKAASWLHIWSPASPFSNLSCPILPSNALPILNIQLRRQGLVNAALCCSPSLALLLAVPSRVRDGGCTRAGSSDLWQLEVLPTRSWQAMRQCLEFYSLRCLSSTKPTNPCKTHPSKSKQVSK